MEYKTFTAYDNSVHLVRADHFIYLDDHDHNEEAEAILKWRTTAPFDKPQLRHVDGMTDRQKKYLEAWTNRLNMNSALAYMRGRDYREFGFETLCQVHGNLYTAPCGCKVHFLFDHHKRTSLVDEDIKPLRVENACDTHVEQRHNSIEGFYQAVARDSRVSQ